MKRSFTLIELIIVIFLISIVYLLMFSNFSLQSDNKYKVTIENLKEFMLKNFEYNNYLSCVCVDDDSKSCFIIIDDNIDEKVMIKSLFKNKPDVYLYDRDLSSLEFDIVKIQEIEYEPIFQLTLSKDQKHNNMVIDMLDDTVYLFKAISLKPEKYSSTNEILDSFYTKQTEVRDAF